LKSHKRPAAKPSDAAQAKAAIKTQTLAEPAEELHPAFY